MALSSLQRRRVLKTVLRVLIPVISVLCISFYGVIKIQFVNWLNQGFEAKGYEGGAIDDVKFIKCFRWFGDCNVVFERHSLRDEILPWLRVGKSLNDDSLYAVDRGLLHHTYLYVHPNDGTQDSISDLAIARDESNVPVQVLQDVNSRAKFKDSSMFHDHDHHKSIWSWIRGSGFHSLSLRGEDWHYKGHGVWCKYSSKSRLDDEAVITDIQTFIGYGFVEPRPMWKVAIHEMNNFGGDLQQPVSFSIQISDKEAHIDPSASNIDLQLRDGEFKILQLSDVHVSSDLANCDVEKCTNYQNTKMFVSRVIQLEKPDMVIFTGDFIDGPNAIDYQTAILKAAETVISAEIPWAVTWGSSDYSKYASKRQILQYLETLPFCLNRLSFGKGDEVSGNTTFNSFPLNNGSDSQVGLIYTLDSTSDENAAEFVRSAYKDVIEHTNRKPLYSLAFQHSPIPEYRPKGPFPIIGSYNDKDPLDVPQLGIREALEDAEIQAMSCSQEHGNDCCLQSSGPDYKKDVWLCYGGHTGVAGHYVSEKMANVRLFRIDDNAKEITTWKRNSLSPDAVYDYQYL